MIPLVDLRAQYASLKEDIDRAALGVLASGAYVNGPDIAALEAEFGTYCGVEHAVALNSGTSALFLALRALGIGEGDEAITAPFTFVATVAAIEMAGAKAVLVDVDPDSGLIDPGAVSAAITSRTAAIVPVHIHGRMADMARLGALAARHGLAVVEDSAQAHGARRGGSMAGAASEIGCFSFYPAKNLGACGEGGMAVTRSAVLAEKMRLLRDWGQERKYEHAIRGTNARMDTIQAAILRVKLRRLEAWIEARAALARRYGQMLGAADVVLPADETSPDRHAWHVYAVRSCERDRLKWAMTSRGIGVGIHYPTPIHLSPAYRDLGYPEGAFPNAERLSRETLSLPMFPELTHAQQDRVAAALVDAAPRSAVAA